MKNPRSIGLRSGLPAPLLMLLMALLGGCAGNAAYHDGPPADCHNPDSSDVCARSYYQQHENFDLAFVEYSERGNAFSDERVKEVLARIESHATASGAVVVVFVHGWKHNASEDDQNLLDFKRTLSILKGTGAVRDRRLIGVYVGWRGASIDVTGLRNITYWDRKAVAEEVGKGGVTRLFLELDRIDRLQPQSGTSGKNVLTFFGHSFGGAITVSAASEVLSGRFVNRSENGGGVAPLGDGIFIINPAIEANQMLHLVESALGKQRSGYPDKQNPVLISISSEADWANHYFFPLGQTVGLLLTWKQTDLQRVYMHDRRPDHAKDNRVLKEEHLDTTTVGNFAPFLTHYLKASPEELETNFELLGCEAAAEVCEPVGLTTLKGQPAIGSAFVPANYPLYFIRTDENVMCGHNDIFNDKVQAFLLAVVNDVIERAWSPNNGGNGATILSKPAELAESADRFFKQMIANREPRGCME